LLAQAVAGCGGTTGEESAGAENTPAATAAARSSQDVPPLPGQNPSRVYWGDEHVHTGLSLDAGIVGTTLGPEEAVRFALGEEVTSSTGAKLKLSRPLDWVAVTDHSDALGSIAALRAGDPAMLAHATAQRWHDMMLKGVRRRLPPSGNW
jgi:hypothetical protein